MPESKLFQKAELFVELYLDPGRLLTTFWKYPLIIVAPDSVLVNYLPCVDALSWQFISASFSFPTFGTNTQNIIKGLHCYFTTFNIALHLLNLSSVMPSLIHLSAAT